MNKDNSKKFDMYEEVTNRIIKELEGGNIPWLKPWHGGGGAWSRSTGKPYTLINQFLLPQGEYITFKELQEEGGELLRDADGKTPKSKQVFCFWYKAVKKEVENAQTGETEEKTILLPKAKYIRVFNVETDTTLDVKYNKEEVKPVDPVAELEAISADYIKREGLKYEEVHGDRAYYSPVFDKVVVPTREQFKESAEFYSTLFHELGHSTGAARRLGRFKPLDAAAAFGSESYSREELVAELTACAVLANTGVETASSFRNSAAYIQGWSKKLKEDNKLFIRASAKAEAAYKLIMNIQDDEDGADA